MFLYLSFRFVNLPASACLLVLANANLAEGADLEISLGSRWSEAEATPLEYEENSQCEQPEALVSMRFEKWFRAKGTNFYPFFLEHSLPKNSITIRRSGEVVEDNTGPRPRESVSSARFAVAGNAKRGFGKANDLTLSGKLYFCEYSGSLTFANAEFDMTGEIGNFVVQSQWTLASTTDQLRILYTHSRLLSEEGEIKAPGALGLGAPRNPPLGSAQVEFFAADVDFDQKDGEGTMPVDVRASFYVSIEYAKETD